MPWWSWVVLGIVLLGAELFGVDAAFYLVFIGLAAIITGLLELAGVGMEPWVQWLVFGALALMSMVFFRARLYKKLRANTPDYEVGPAGESIRLETMLEKGDTCRQNFRGTTWTILNGGDTTIEPGSEALISEVKGLTLIVTTNK